MDYRQFVEAMRRDSESDEEKRRARIAAIRQQNQEKQAAQNAGPSNPLEFIGEMGKGILDAVTSIPRKAIRTLQAAGNQEEVMAQLNELDQKYKRGEINKQMLEKEVNDVTKDIVGNAIKVTDKGVEQASQGEQDLNFLRQTVGAGVDTASVLPIARGVQMSLRAGRTLASGTAKEGFGNYLKRSAVNNAQQAAVYGTADTANDLLQGRDVNAGSVALNYALPFAGGTAFDVGGAAIGRGIRNARGAAKAGATAPAPEAVRASLARPYEDINSAVRPEVPAARPGDVEDAVSPEDVQYIVNAHRQRFSDQNVRMDDSLDKGTKGAYSYQEDMIKLSRDYDTKKYTYDHESVHKAIGQFLNDADIESLYKDVVAVSGGKRALTNKYREIGYKDASWRTAAEEDIANKFGDFMQQGFFDIQPNMNATRATDLLDKVTTWANNNNIPKPVVDIFMKLAESIRSTYRQKTDVAGGNIIAFYNRLNDGDFKTAVPRTEKYTQPLNSVAGMKDAIGNLGQGIRSAASRAEDAFFDKLSPGIDPNAKASLAGPDLPTGNVQPGIVDAGLRDDSGLVDPRTGLRAVDAPEGAGVVTRSREQIMKDNKVVRPFWQRVNEALFDSNAPLKEFGREYSARTGKTLDVANDPHALAQLRNGMDEAAAANMQTLVNDMSYIRKNKLSDQWKEYGIANQVVNDRAGIYPASVVQAEQAKLDAIRSNLSPEELAQVEAAVQKTIDFQDSQMQRLRESGFISQAGYDAIKEVNPNYFSRFNFADYIQENQRLFASSNSKNISQNLIKAVKGVGDDARFIIEDPAEAITRAAFKTENILQNNAIFKSVRNLRDELPDMVIQVRDSADVNTRRALSFENQELRPVLRQVDRIVKSDNASIRRLETEINRLEKQGLKISLGQGGQRMTPGDMTVAGLGGEVSTGQAGKVIPDANDASDLLTQLDRALARTKKAEQSLGGLTKAEREAREKAYKKAKAVSDGLRQDVIAEQAGTRAVTTGSQMGSSDTAAFVRNLIENNSQADINHLKKMVGRRDEKLAKVLDDVSIAKQDYDDMDTIMRANRDEISARADGEAPKGYEIVSGWNDGVEERIAIPQWIADAYKGKNDAQLDALGRIMMSASKPFKAAATVLSPAFLVKNSIRDTGTHWLTSSNISKAERALIVPYAKRWVQGFMDSITNSDFAQQVSKAGGGAAGVFADAGGTRTMVQDEAVRGAAKSITGTAVESSQGLFKKAMGILDKYSGFQMYRTGMQRAGRALEYAPRLAEARAAIENGASDPAAALAARQALGDLQNGGTVGRMLNNYTPFFNSILQGNKRILDSAMENPQNAIAMLGMGIALPVVSGYAWNRTMYPDVLDNISEYERENNFIIILGDEKDENGRYTQVLKIPKNDAAKVFGNNLEVALDKMAGNDSQGFAELFMKTIGYAQPVQIERDGEFSLDALVGSAPVASSPLIKTPFELATNKSLFTGNDIVPEYKQALSSRDQVDEKTAPIDALAAQVGISPYQSAAVRQGVSASLLNGKNPVDQVSNVVSGTNGTRATNEFYQLRNAMRDERTRASSAVNKAIAANDIAAAQDIARRYNEKFKSTFDPWVEQYGSQATPEMREGFLALRLVLNSSSIKQRRSNLKKNA